MKSIIYSLISAFIVWIVNQVTSLSIFLGILIFIASISILVNINFLLKWILVRKETSNLKTTINQSKDKNELLLKEIKQLQDELDKLHQNQTALNDTIEEKNNSIDDVSRRANMLGSVINTLIAQDNTDKLAPYVNNLLQIGKYTNDK
ncbi:hypothetical protein [Leuconostoc citreum]|uniref:hypothetical protein n=1 Tax=Leuconostoc citreum TaxID=33964 RepID=UPI0032DFBC8E